MSESPDMGQPSWWWFVGRNCGPSTLVGMTIFWRAWDLVFAPKARLPGRRVPWRASPLAVGELRFIMVWESRGARMRSRIWMSAGVVALVCVGALAGRYV